MSDPERTPPDAVAERILKEAGDHLAESGIMFDRETGRALERLHRQASAPLPAASRDRGWYEVRNRIAATQNGHRTEPAAVDRMPVFSSFAPVESRSDRGTELRNRGHRRGLRPAWAAVAAAVVLLGAAAVLAALAVGRRGNDSASLPAPSVSSQVATFRGDNGRTGVMPGPAPGGAVIVRWHYEVGETLLASPAVVDGVVYAAGGTHVGDGEPTALSAGAVVAIDADTGELIWRTSTNAFVGSSPAVSGGLVYAGTDAGELLALEAETGDVRWRVDLGKRAFTSSPAVSNGVVYITGGEVTSSPSVADGIVYTGGGPSDSGSGRSSLTVAVDAATGEERWRFESRENGFFAIDAKSGARVWFFPTGALDTNSAAVSGGVAYVVDGTAGTLHALDAETGERRWSFELDALAIYATPAVDNGMVYVTDQLGNLVAVDAATGAERWRYVADALINASPVVAGDAVYLADRAGNVVIVDAATGQERAVVPNAGMIGHGAVASPIVVDGMLYVARADGLLVAFGAPP